MREIDEHAVEVVMRASKLTAQLVYQAMRELAKQPIHAIKDVRHEHKLRRREMQRQKIQQPKTGKQHLSKLKEQGKQLSFVALEDKADLAALKKELNRYKVDFSIVKEGKETFHIFFKAQDAEQLNLAMKHVLKDYDEKNVSELADEQPLEKEPSLNTEPTLKQRETEPSIDEAKQDPLSKGEPHIQPVSEQKEKGSPMEKEEAIEVSKETVDSYKKSSDLSGIKGTPPPSEPSDPQKPSVRKRLDKAKKEAAAFNQSVQKTKEKMKAPKHKGVER